MYVVIEEFAGKSNIVKAEAGFTCRYIWKFSHVSPDSDLRLLRQIAR